MRRSAKTRKPGNEASPDDTQEMFTQGAAPAVEPDEEETRDLEQETGEPETEEYRAVEAAETTELDESEIEAIEEEEAPVEEEYEDWDEDYDEEFDEEEATGPDDSGEAEEEVKEKKPRGEDVKVWYGEFRTRASAIWKGSLKKVGDIRLPNHELDGQKVLVVSGIAFVVLLFGAAGYVLGKGSGEDVDSARLEGEYAGRKAGAVAGATKGYAAGFKKGRDAAFEKSYAASYRRNYRRAYEKAGMEVPKAKDIEVPEP